MAFPAYLSRENGVILFNAKKAACHGVVAHLRSHPCGIDLVEMEVDFAELQKKRSDFRGAWFRGVSSRVQAAGLSGNQIQEDNLFQDINSAGVMSNVTIPWTYEGFEYSIMLTSAGAVVFVENYPGNVAMELRIVMDVYQNLLKDVYREKKRRAKRLQS